MAGIAWPVIHAERAALAHDVTALSETDWATPCRCAATRRAPGAGASGVATARMTPTRFRGGSRLQGGQPREQHNRAADRLNANGPPIPRCGTGTANAHPAARPAPH